MNKAGTLSIPPSLKYFRFKFKYGNSVKALDDPNSIVISQEMAEQFFGSDDPVGKQMLNG